MDYMTLNEASEKWGVTPRQINYLCAGDVYKRQGQCRSSAENGGRTGC